MSTTLDGAYRLSLGGLLIGGPDSPYRIDENAISGLGAAPTAATDVDDPSRSGAIPMRDRARSRVVNCRVHIIGTTSAEVEDLAIALAGKWSTADVDQDLYLRVWARTYRLRGRPRRCELDLRHSHAGIAAASLQFVATDPTLYGALEQQANLPLTSTVTSGGMDVPAIVPIQLGGLGGVINVVNAGQAISYPRIVIPGPVVNPRIENLTTGEQVRLITTLAVPGDTATIDLAARNVQLGTVDRLDVADFAATTWWGLRPGSNLVAFRADSSTGTPVATLTWSDAYLL